MTTIPPDETAITGRAYRERLLPRWWAWLVPLALVGMLAVAYGAALGTPAGVAVGSGGAAIAGWLVWITSPVVSVESGHLAAGSARLPLTSVRAVRAVDRDEITALRGPGADARVFVELRPLSAPAAVLLTLADPDDPHPAWLISTRHPDRLEAALAARIGAAGR